MTVQDLPAILRLIARAHAASIIVVDGEDSVMFALSDLDIESELAFKSIMHRVYRWLDRQNEETPWAFSLLAAALIGIGGGMLIVWVVTQ
jgi:hypothetical protein